MLREAATAEAAMALCTTCSVVVPVVVPMLVLPMLLRPFNMLDPPSKFN
jgi:hypothetical protein